MKFLYTIFFLAVSLAALVPSQDLSQTQGIQESTISTNSNPASAPEELVNRDLLSIGKKKAKLLKKLAKKKKSIVDELGSIVSSLDKIEKLKKEKYEDEEWEDEDGKSSFDEWKDELIEKTLTKVFISLKNSELINPILKFSLTDDKVRAELITVTIEILKADVIPYREIFVALRDSGLALQVIEFLLTDPETRQGQIDLILELIPRLLEEGVINFDDILKSLPSSIPIPKFTFPTKTVSDVSEMTTVTTEITTSI